MPPPLSSLLSTFLVRYALPLLLATPVLAEDLRVLQLEYPPPKILGTPTPVRPANLEPPNAQPPIIRVPADVTNLARGRPVTSSESWPIIGELGFITDGDKESDDGYYVELGDGLQWVQIDLEQRAEIYAVAIWHYHAQVRAYHSVVVQVADDPEFKTGVKTIFNNDHDNSSGLGRGTDHAYLERNTGKLIDARRSLGRYVRLYSRGNTNDDLNHYIEVEVYGRPVP
jgi:hypothetical protein